MARPIKQIKKSKTITVHCTTVEYLLINRKARDCGISMSEFLLKVGQGKSIQPRLTDEELELFRAIAGMANNLNQIAKKLNEGEALQLEVLQDLQRVSALIQTFYDR